MINSVYDLVVISGIYKAASYLDAFISPEHISLPHPLLYPAARFSLWAVYSFWTGLFQQAFGLLLTSAAIKHFLSPSSSTTVLAGSCIPRTSLNFYHSGHVIDGHLKFSLGVPYHSWRITHAKHHASTGHMTQDQVFVPKTRSQLGLPAFDPTKEDILGSSVSQEVMKELKEALGDSPLGTTIGAATYLVRRMA